MEKAEARAEIKRRIASLTPEQRAEKSRKVVRSLLALPEYLTSRAVMFFVPMDDEVDLNPAIDRAAEEGKIVLVPKCEPRKYELLICRIMSRDELVRGHFGILEPAVVRRFPPTEIDLLIVPGLGFDERGNRLGRGAGYYDRFMNRSDLRAVRCAVAFEEQVLPEIPHDEHDLPIHILVTDERVRRFQSS